MRINNHTERYRPNVVTSCQDDFQIDGFSNSETIFFHFETSRFEGFSTSWLDVSEDLPEFLSCEFVLGKMIIKNVNEQISIFSSKKSF